MTRTRPHKQADVLQIPDDPRLPALRVAWRPRTMSRTSWLRKVENVLAEHYPDASSAELRVTARSYAPFTLRAGAYVA